jgi:hypothetical protein
MSCRAKSHDRKRAVAFVITMNSTSEESAKMAIRNSIARLFVASGCAIAFAVVPVVTATPAGACLPNFNTDPFTGQCSAPGQFPTVNGITCIPGRHLGTCMGMLQNMPGGFNPWP